MRAFRIAAVVIAVHAVVLLAWPSAAFARCGEVSYQPAGESSDLCPGAVSAAGIAATAALAAAAVAAAVARSLVRGAMPQAGLTSAVQAMTGAQAAPSRPLLQPHPRHAHLPIVDAASGVTSSRPAGGGPRTGGFTAELLNPKPNTVYRVDGRHLFVTDEHGRVVNVQTRLTPVSTRDARRKRSGTSQARAGGRWRRRKGGLINPRRQEQWSMSDHGGHYAAASLGGPGEAINIVAMVERINAHRVRDLYPPAESWRAGLAHYQENYYVQEKRWRRLLRINPQTDIFLDIHTTFPAPPLDDPTAVSLRPKSFTVYETIDGVQQEPMRFRNDTWP